MSDVHSQLDALLHDAEHAEGGATFARVMRDIASADRLAAEAKQLRAEAATLAGAHGITLCVHHYVESECDACTPFTAGGARDAR